jgi:hypothetical protein
MKNIIKVVIGHLHQHTECITESYTNAELFNLLAEKGFEGYLDIDPLTIKDPKTRALLREFQEDFETLTEYINSKVTL